MEARAGGEKDPRVLSSRIVWGTAALISVLAMTICILGPSIEIYQTATHGEPSSWLVTTTRNISSTPIIPVPTPAQLRYQSTDFVALIHFNMATYAHDGDPGCDASNWNSKAPTASGPTSSPDTFSPSKLNTTQWFDSINALGAKIAVLTAKHGCGFLLWPTNATLSNAPYQYHTNFDLLQEFVDSARASGVGYGFYYSIMKNFYLCRSFSGTNSCTQQVLQGQHNVSNAKYQEIVYEHLTELYTNYGDLAEIWIDSRLEGFGPLMDKLQPNAGGTPSNPRQWCGTESGFPSRDVGPGSIWQTGYGFFGNPSSSQWVDKFCDPQLFQDHVWFFEPNRAVKTLKELIPIYHDIVGRGMVMELAFAINRDGLVDPLHQVVYEQLGQWTRDCYGCPIVSVENTVGDYRIGLELPPEAEFDRIVLQEDVAVGQRIRNYTIHLELLDANNTHTRFPLVSNGTSIGRKHIHLLPPNNASKEPQRQRVELTITNAIAPPHLSLFGVYKSCYPESSSRTSPQEDNTGRSIS